MPFYKPNKTLIQRKALSLAKVTKRAKKIARDEELKEIYIAFCSFGKGEENHIMSSKCWIKLCRECGFMTKKLNLCRLDLIFVKKTRKAIGAKRVDYAQFCDLLVEAAHVRGCSVHDLVDAIKARGGPTARATVPTDVRFARKEAFTGTWRFGGPNKDDREKWGFAWMMDRSPYDVRGCKDHHDPKKPQGEKVGYRTIVVETEPSAFKKDERKTRMESRNVKTVGNASGRSSPKSKKTRKGKKNTSAKFMQRKLQELAEFMTSHEEFGLSPEEFKDKVRMYVYSAC